MNQKINKILNEDIPYSEIINHLKEKYEILGLTEKDVFKGEGYSNRFLNNNDSNFEIKYSIVPKIGISAAGIKSYYTLYHDYAHMIDFVEKQPERLLKNSFDLNYKTKVKVFDEEYEQPTTYKAVQREIRVMAIQTKLMAHNFDIDENLLALHMIKESLSSLEYMEDFLNIPVDKNIPHKDKKSIRLKIIEKEYINCLKKLSLKEILEKTKKVKEIRNIENWLLDDIIEKSFYNIPVEELSERCDVWSCWQHLDNPITEKEIEECLKRNKAELIDTEILENKKPINKKKLRLAHIKKIAYFVKNRFDNPIDIDVGVPELNAPNLGHIIMDGNHRLAAAIYRGDKNIKANIHGSTDYIKEIGLYYPNAFLLAFEDIISKPVKEYGFANSKLTSEENYYFQKLKTYYSKTIPNYEFSENIDVENFIEEEGLSPEEIINQDPDVTFYKVNFDGRKIYCINHSGDDHIFSNIDISKVINSMKEKLDQKQELEEDLLSWLLHPKDSVFVYPNNGKEQQVNVSKKIKDSLNKNQEIKIFSGKKGLRYQLIQDNNVVAGIQLKGNVIKNRYTSDNCRQQGLSNQLINIIKLEKPELEHSDIQTEIGKISSKNTGLKKRNKI
tara:strand:- start:12323 stop:14164 length:1842 start_codon:yes stop_codon:yes gene_type:complete